MAVHTSLGDTVLQLDGALNVLLLEGASALAPEGELVIVALGSPSEVCLGLVLRGLAGSVICNTVAAGKTSWSLAEARAVILMWSGALAVTPAFHTVGILALLPIVFFFILCSFSASRISLTLHQRAKCDLPLLLTVGCRLFVPHARPRFLPAGSCSLPPGWPVGRLGLH